MGLFDYIVCEYPLPDDSIDQQFGRTAWQTKDTDAQFMETYRITKDGHLVHEAVEYHEVPKEKRPYPDAEPGSIQEMFGMLGKRSIGDQIVPFHGALRFYGQTDKGEWKEYVALFDRGQLIRIDEKISDA